MKKLSEIPEGLVPVKYIVEAWKLKPRKQKFTYQNIEPRFGTPYYIWSRYSKCYYKREIQPENSVHSLTDSIKRGIVYLDPTQEQKDVIQAEMESNNMTYYQLQEFRLTEFLLDKHIRLGNRSYAYLSKKVELETLLTKIRNHENN